MRTSGNSTFHGDLVASEIVARPNERLRSHILDMDGYQWSVWLIHSNDFRSLARRLPTAKPFLGRRKVATASRRGGA